MIVICMYNNYHFCFALYAMMIIFVVRSKFTSEDIPLFIGITKDLFPGIQLPVPDYNTLQKYIQEACETYNLQPTQVFIGRYITYSLQLAEQDTHDV